MPSGRGSVDKVVKVLGQSVKIFGPLDKTLGQMVKTQVGHFVWTLLALLDHFGTLTSLPCLAIFGPKWTIFDASQPWIYGSMVPKWLEFWTSHGLSIFRLNGLPFWA